LRPKGSHSLKGGGFRGTVSKLGAILLIGPGLGYVALFLLVPLILTVALSLSGASYYHIVTIALYRDTILRSLRVAVEVCTFSLLLGYPCAYYLAKLTSMRRETVVVLLLFPLFVSFLIRTYSWIYVLGSGGFFNYVLLAIGLINSPMQFLYNEGAIVLGLVNYTLPFMIIPIYTSVEKVDNNLIEMSKNLGANDILTFKEVVFPLSVPGVASGVMLTFITSFGAYITPAILGGPAQAMIANMVSVLFLIMLDWPLGTALSVILVIVTLGILYLYNKVVGLDRLLEAMG
jgi:spermidine/putrescine transport system permease protein